jgi:trigger factor
MEITRENTDVLVAKISIKMEPGDYTEAVEKRLKKLQQRASIPGFRPGKVPSGMIKKMYGAQVRSEEVGQMTIDALFNYLRENALDYLADPLPGEEQQIPEWDKETTYHFEYEVGLMPAIEVNMPSAKGLNEYEIEMSEEDIQKEYEKILKEFGTFTEKEVVSNEDFIFGSLDLGTQLSPEGEETPWIKDNVYLPLEKMANDEIRGSFIGKKVGDCISVEIKTLLDDPKALAVYLNEPDESALDALPENGVLTITRISGREPAEVNQELYDRVFGEGVVTDDASFRTFIGQYLASPLRSEIGLSLMLEIKSRLESSNPFEMPERFLKKWLPASNRENKSFSLADMELNWPEYLNAFRWEVISTKIAKENELSVLPNELKEEASRVLKSKLRSMGYPYIPEDREAEMLNRFMQNRGEMERLQRNMLDSKVLDHVRKDLKLKVKTISSAEAEALINEKQAAIQRPAEV